MGFDITFGLQHWVFYPAGKGDELEDEREIVGGVDEEGRGLLPGGSRDEREYSTIGFVPPEDGRK